MQIIGAIFILFFSCALATSATADTIQFSIIPNKCISLRKGQTCFQRVVLRWQSTNQSERPDLMCLWRDGDPDALKCWQGQATGEFRYNLAEKKTTGFYLVAGEQQLPVVARAEVKITWVYSNRSSGRTRWRLF